MRWLRLLHRYLGFVAAGLLLVLAVTGGVLIFKEEIWRLRFPDLAEPLLERSSRDHAQAIAAIAARHGEKVVLVRVPQPEVRAYHVYLRDGEALWRQDGSGLIHEWAWYASPLGILTELHTHLAAGEFGKQALGVLGFVTAFMAITGVVIWWPVRRQFRLAALAPANLRRITLLRLHRDLGSLAAAFIILFAVTASAVVYGPTTRALFNSLLAPGVEPSPAPRVQAQSPVPPPSAAMVERVREAFPQARLKSWSPPPRGSAVHYFRVRQPGEVHPNGRSTVRVNARDGQIVLATDATLDPAGDRLANWMYPLHAATWGGWPYRLVALMSAIALGVISLTGMVCFVRGLRPLKRPPR